MERALRGRPKLTGGFQEGAPVQGHQPLDSISSSSSFPLFCQVS